MLTNYVSCQYVVTTVTLYRSALVDLSRSRSVHAVEHDPCCPDPTKLSAAECRAVHYGLCSPLLKLPPFSIPPLTPSAPSSPATPKGSSQSGSKPSTPTATITTPPLTVPKVDLEILDPVELLAVDLEGKLEALVNTFVAQDKVRLAARKKAEASGTTTTSSNLAKVSPLMPSAPQSPSLQPGKVVASVTPQAASATSAKADRKGKEERLTETEGKTLPSVFTGNHTVETGDGKRFGPGSPKVKKTNKASTKGERRDLGDKQVIPGEAKQHVVQKIGEPRPSKDALKLDSKKCAINNQYKIKDDSKGSVKSEVMPTKVSADYQQVKMTGTSLAKISPEHKQKDANVCMSPGIQAADVTDPKLVIFHKEQLHSPPSIAKFQGVAIKAPMDLQQQAMVKPLATSILSSLKPSAEYQQTGVKAQITKFASKEKEGLQTSPVSSLERRLSPRTKTQDPLAVSSPTTSAPTPLSLETLQELLVTSSTPSTVTEPIPTTIFQSTRIPSMSYEASTSSMVPDSNTHASPSLTALPQPQNILPSSTNTALSAVEGVRFQHDHKSTKDNRPSSYPSTAYKDLEMSPVHQRSTSQALLPENYSHQLDTFRQDINSLSDTSHRMKPNQEFIQSAVDYAKTRFQHVQQGPKVDDAKPRPKNGHLVSEAKFRWEHLPGVGLSSQQMWPGSLPLGDQMALDPESNISEPLRDVLQRSGHRRALSMEGLIDTPSPSIPHPKLTTAQKQHIRERSLSPTDRHSHVPIRPFLTKGSVAERVLLFECCPDRALERAASGAKTKPVLISTWRAGVGDVHNKTQFWEVVADVDKRLLGHHYNHKDKENIEPSPRSSSLRRIHKSSTQPVHIPRFYFPEGKPQSQADIEIHLQKVAAVFSGLNEGRATREEFGIITKACGLPLYWKLPLFLAARGDKKTSISCDAFLEYWRRVVNTCHDEASKFVRVMSRGARSYLLPEDFIPMMQDVIDSHPGLTFLKEATEFHSRYIHTVIARIYYCVNRSWSGRITVPELRKSNFLQVLSTLEEEEDINQITEYFSYEHFYVIYCKFWELDKDHDLYIDQNDLKRHNGGALSARIIDRIFSGAVTRGPVQKEGKMSYTEFVWFLISEEDKRHPRSIEYWFRCMDKDGDGFLSMYELEFFYEEQLQRLEALGIETLPFKDCLCQMLDIIKPKTPGKISLADLKKCRMTPIFFDSFFNLEKYLDHEQRDPFASQRQEHEGEGPEMSDWDRYAAEEYELLVAEEGASEQQDELMYEEYEPEDDELSPNLDKLTTGGVPSRTRSSLSSPDTEDDEYDYAESDADYHY